MDQLVLRIHQRVVSLLLPGELNEARRCPDKGSKVTSDC